MIYYFCYFYVAKYTFHDVEYLFYNMKYIFLYVLFAGLIGILYFCNVLTERIIHSGRKFLS